MQPFQSAAPLKRAACLAASARWRGENSPRRLALHGGLERSTALDEQLDDGTLPAECGAAEGRLAFWRHAVERRAAAQQLSHEIDMALLARAVEWAAGMTGSIAAPCRMSCSATSM